MTKSDPFEFSLDTDKVEKPLNVAESGESEQSQINKFCTKRVSSLDRTDVKTTIKKAFSK